VQTISAMTLRAMRSTRQGLWAVVLQFVGEWQSGLKTSYCKSVTYPVSHGFAMSSVGGMAERPTRVRSSDASYSGGPSFKFRHGEVSGLLVFYLITH